MALNDKQKLFCETYVANGYDLRKAYIEAYPNCVQTSASNSAYRLFKREDIKEYIKEIQKERFEALSVNADRIGEELSKMAFSEFDDNNNANSKLKALELLGKQLGLYTQKIDADVNNTGEITINIV